MAWKKPSRWSLEVFVLVILSGTAISGLEIPPLLQSGGVVYDKSKLQASMFRNISAPLFFHVWPEDFKKTRYFCEDFTGNHSLVNFTSSDQGNVLDPRPYYDVGIADAYQSTLGIDKHFWAVDTNRRTYPLRCEYHDLQALYRHRYDRVVWISVDWSFAFLAIFELATFASTSFFWLFPGFIIADPVLLPDPDLELGVTPRSDLKADDPHAHPHADPHPAPDPAPDPASDPAPEPAPDPEPQFSPRIIAFKWIVLMSVMDNCADVLHINILSSASFLLIENVGHSDIRGWRPTAFYNVGVLYKQIAIVAIVAAFLHQICLALPSENIRIKLRDKERELWTYFTAPHRRFRWWEYCRKSMQLLNEDPVTKTSDDWRWQRVFGQGAVILLTGTLLLSVEDNTGTSLDNLASLLLAAVVVACSWSLGVASVSLFKSLFFLVGKISGVGAFVDRYACTGIVVFCRRALLIRLNLSRALHTIVPLRIPPCQPQFRSIDGIPYFDIFQE